MSDFKRTILEGLSLDIARLDCPENRHNYQRFSKTKLDNPEGLKAPILRNISTQRFPEIQFRPVAEILTCCDYLLESERRYMRFFAFEWALKARRHFTPAHFRLFERWLKKYVGNWGECDHLCCGAIGHLLEQFPKLAEKTRPWRKSKSLWLRRAAAVCLIVPVRKKLLLAEVLNCAETLLVDPEDLVQKGYGWMLKEATKPYAKEIFAWVMAHKERMPRTALRYAIEKLPEPQRKQAMAK